MKVSKIRPQITYEICVHITFDVWC